MFPAVTAGSALQTAACGASSLHWIWDLLFILTSGVAIWTGYELQYILTSYGNHVIYQLTETWRVQVKDVSAAVCIEMFVYQQGYVWSAACLLACYFLYLQINFTVFIQFGGEWGHMPRHSLVFSFEAILCKKDILVLNSSVWMFHLHTFWTTPHLQIYISSPSKVCHLVWETLLD